MRLGNRRADERDGGSRQITANTVHPPVTDAGWVTEAARQEVTDRDLIHIAEPDDVASAITYLASYQSGLITRNVIRPPWGVTFEPPATTARHPGRPGELAKKPTEQPNVDSIRRARGGASAQLPLHRSPPARSPLSGRRRVPTDTYGSSMQAVRALYVVTHPESTHHLEDKVGGWYESVLTERGHEQALAIAARLRELVPLDAEAELFSSDLQRTVQTAIPIAAALGVRPTFMHGLREKSYGVAGGRPQSWLDERFVPPPPTGERLNHDEGIAGAETKLEWVKRVYEAMHVVLARPSAHQVIVTHGGSASWVIGAWIGLPIEATAYASFRSTSGSITVLREDDYFHNRAMVTLNDTSHL